MIIIISSIIISIIITYYEYYYYYDYYYHYYQTLPSDPLPSSGLLEQQSPSRGGERKWERRLQEKIRKGGEENEDDMTKVENRGEKKQ